jgi:hypothetical protein
MPREFHKRLDDAVREELMALGHEFSELVEAVEETADGGAVVRLRPPFDDVNFEPPDDDLPSDVFAARVRRRIKVALEAPERPAAPPESV